MRSYRYQIYRINVLLSFLSLKRLTLPLCIALTGCTWHPMTPRGVSDIGEVLPFGSQTTPYLLNPTSPEPEDYSAMAELQLSAGDAVQLQIYGDELFTGRYVINQNGNISIPFLPPIQAAGITSETLTERLSQQLLKERIFKPDQLRIALEVVEWAPVQVSVTGAVYTPGQVVINRYRLDREKSELELRAGAATVQRYIQHAITAAGGLRPDANLNTVSIQRGDRIVHLSLVNHFLGKEVSTFGLISGDRLSIGSHGVFQEELARPSAFTAPGFRVYLSNLTTPALSNASSSIGEDSTRLPNGARLSHAIASANCFGGTPMINASRRIKYVSRNPVTEQTTTHVYSVEEVMLRANSTVHNPYLLPEDQLGCYEGPVTILREAARTAYDLLLPGTSLELLRGLRSE